MATRYSDAAKYKIEHAGRVSLPVYEVVAGFFYATAALTFLGRIIVRLVIRRKLTLDDYVLILAFACLTAATVLYYNFAWLIYVLSILRYDRTVLPTLEDLKAIMNAQAINYSLVALLWSAICPVKLCFLVSFKALIKNVSRTMNIFYWVSVVCVFIFWVFMIALSWMECPYTGAELLQKCTPEPPKHSLLAAVWTCFVFDMITDAMIVAIPIWILRNVKIRMSQKLGIAAFLCLSVAMIIISFLRAVLSRYRGMGDLTIQYLLIYLEAAIAVTMAAVASYRAVFVERNRQRELEQQQLRSPEQTPPVINFRGKFQKALNTISLGSDTVDSTKSNKYVVPRPKHIGSKLGMMTYLQNSREKTQNSVSVTQTSTSMSMMSTTDLESGNLSINDSASAKLSNYSTSKP